MSPETISAREFAALRQLATGDTIKQVAAAFGRSERTIKTTLGRAYEKLGAVGHVEAFLRLGWLRPPNVVAASVPACENGCGRAAVRLFRMLGHGDVFLCDTCRWSLGSLGFAIEPAPEWVERARRRALPGREEIGWHG